MVDMAAACALHCARAGQYNEQVFKALDFVLSEAAKAGMRVIVALTDYWKPTDSVQQARAAPPGAASPRGSYWGLGGGFCGGLENPSSSLAVSGRTRARAHAGHVPHVMGRGRSRHGNDDRCARAVRRLVRGRRQQGRLLHQRRLPPAVHDPCAALCQPARPPIPPHPGRQPAGAALAGAPALARGRADTAPRAARVNSVTGKRYRDDPTIFAYDLLCARARGPACAPRPAHSRPVLCMSPCKSTHDIADWRAVAPQE